MGQAGGTRDRFVVLLVDDNDQDLALIKRGFADSDLEADLYTVGDGQQCMAFLRREGERETMRVRLRNPSSSLAFQTRLRVTKDGTDDEILPVFWDDNYITLLPGEEREVSATYAVKDLGGARPQLKVDGFNVAAEVRPATHRDGRRADEGEGLVQTAQVRR